MCILYKKIEKNNYYQSINKYSHINYHNIIKDTDCNNDSDYDSYYDYYNNPINYDSADSDSDDDNDHSSIDDEYYSILMKEEIENIYLDYGYIIGFYLNTNSIINTTGIDDNDYLDLDILFE